MCHTTKRSRSITPSFITAILAASLMFVISPQQALATTSSEYASDWSVNNDADWTPFPPSTSPLGAPDDSCAGVSTPTGSWAEFTFPALDIPTSDTINGIEVRFKYKSGSTNTAQLTDGSSLIGEPQTVSALTGSNCSSTDWVSAGGSSDVWTTSLTPSDFNSGTIGVRITQDANTIDLDSVELIVHH